MGVYGFERLRASSLSRLERRQRLEVREEILKRLFYRLTGFHRCLFGRLLGRLDGFHRIIENHLE